jgi:hypothetical protein
VTILLGSQACSEFYKHSTYYFRAPLRDHTLRRRSATRDIGSRSPHLLELKRQLLHWDLFSNASSEDS